MSETIGYIVIAVGVAFDLLGAIGLVRLPDVYNRLQAATKCVTLGTSLILIGVFITYGFSQVGILSLIAMAFVLITSPTGSHALARASHKSGVPLAPVSVIDMYAEDEGRCGISGPCRPNTTPIHKDEDEDEQIDFGDGPLNEEDES
jgi:multicomponent Na+:H+ antiporter subunit G